MSGDTLAEPTGERRQLTVMFCDLVGSTALSGRMDPEDLREVISRYHQACARAIANNDGFLAQYLGDGIMAYFGYPAAQEDAAEKAVRAGLEILRELPSVGTPFGSALEARLGAATGVAVVGDLIGSGATELAAVIGAVPNIAARVQSVAAPGTFLIADSTRRLVGNVFEMRSLGIKDFKGLDRGIEVWQVLAERPESVRFDALRGPSPSRLVGRENEVAEIAAAWEAASASRGQVVWIAGDPGIGKSRLLRELGTQLVAMFRVSLQCSARYSGSPLHPLISYLQRLAGIDDRDLVDVKYEKIENIARPGRLSEEVPLIASLLSVPPIARYPEPSLSPQERKTRTLDMLTGQLISLTDKQPVFMTLEDAQWMDPTTADLVDRVIVSLVDRRLLVLVAARPEYSPRWRDLGQVHNMRLRALDHDACSRLIRQVAGDRVLVPGIINAIIEKTDGVPLYVEELTKSLLESAETQQAETPSQGIHGVFATMIPASLQDILRARLDRQGSAKEVAQVGAAIGRVFSLPMLASVLKWSESRLLEALESLIAAELVFARKQSPSAEFVFKHALVQDAAYESLLRTKRRSLHSRIAEVIASDFPDLTAKEPETIAHHWALAEQPVRAAEYWLRAAKRSLTRSANVEAIGHANQALRQLDKCGDSTGRGKLAFGLYLVMGQASYVVHGPAAAETVSAYSHAQQLVEAVDDAEERCALLYGIFSGYHFAAKFDLAEEPARRVLALATREQNPWQLCQAHRMLGYISFFRGECDQALLHFRELSRLYQEGSFSALAPRYGADCLVGARGFQILIDCLRGSASGAQRMADENLEFAFRLGHPATIGWAYASQSYLSFFLRDPAAVQRITEIGAQYCRANNVAAWGAHCEVFAAWSTAVQERSGGASVAAIRARIEEARASTALGIPMLKAALAEVLALDERISEAITETECAIREIAQTGQYFFDPAVRLTLAEALARTSEDEAVVAPAFQTAAEAAALKGFRVLTDRANSGLRKWREAIRPLPNLRSGLMSFKDPVR